MPDTYFTAPPHWTWYIIPYFFVGGIAGGSVAIAALLDFFGRDEDRAVARLGFYVAAVGCVLSAVLLTLDLGRPLRFWHMVLQSNRLPAPMLKVWSPMSLGAWALLLLGLLTTLSALGALAEEKRIPWPALTRLRRGVPGGAVTIAGALLGLFMAGYTGVLLSVTNRPIWADSPFVGVLFLVSGASTAAATLSLLGRSRAAPGTLHWLQRFDGRLLVLEIAVLAMFLISLGPVAQAWLNGWGAVLLLGVLGAGILVPLAIHNRPRWFGERISRRAIVTAASLVLIGGLLLRVCVILASEAIDRATLVAG